MDVKKEFSERVDEINAYLDLLDLINKEAQSGSPELGGKRITPQQQHILYSSVYLQLYNLTEATVTWCLRALTQTTGGVRTTLPSELSEDMLREWVKAHAKTSVPLNADNRLKEMLAFSKLLLSGRPLEEWDVAVGGGGNWDDRAIERLAEKLGLTLTVTPGTRTAVKTIVRDDCGALVLVKKLRNKLAHGAISFTECGTNVAPSDLRDLAERITLYLREVVELFLSFITNGEYLKTPPSAPAGGLP